MFHSFDHRFGHYCLLLVIGSILCFPNLGVPSLWDIDEGNNATCSAEMHESGDYILPTFNYQMREDKPALLYWLQVACYHFFGINEWSARLPSALAVLVALLAVYELGRRMFNPAVGLLAGVVLATTPGLCAAGHFANPDALLHACTLLAMLACYCGHVTPIRARIGSFCWFGFWTGLGVMAKGPVGLVLPLAAGLLFLLWEGQLRRLTDWRQIWGVLAFLLVAAPWYVGVALETKGEWLHGFLLKHNLQRALSPMENHGGSLWYYPIVLLVGFGLWSCFAIPIGCNAVRRLRTGTATERAPIRFLLCWIVTYLLAFSIARTKLPNYVLPLYPAGAILVACFLNDWRRNATSLPGWFLPASLYVLSLVGLFTAVSFLIASGVLPGLPVERRLPGFERLTWLGIIPLAGAGFAWWYFQRQQRTRVTTMICVTSVIFVASLAAWLPGAMDALKAPRGLAQLLPSDQLYREVRLASMDYFQPSLNFYCRREVSPFLDREHAVQFLDSPVETYLFLPAESWQSLRPLAPATTHLLGHRRDLFRNCDVVVVCNR